MFRLVLTKIRLFFEALQEHRRQLAVSVLILIRWDPLAIGRSFFLMLLRVPKVHSMEPNFSVNISNISRLYWNLAS
jgi:hypothetical protein